MPTELFIRRPLLWLTFATRVRATILCSPNFGYKHYLKVLGERSVEELDLSSVRFIFNGAEPISVELCEEFLTRLAPAKLPRNSMYPVYGLAEASLAVAFPPVGAPLRTIALNRHRMRVGDPLELVSGDHPDAVQVVCEGKAIPYCRVRIAGDDDIELPEDRIGHVHMTGENVTRGYYEDPAANAAAFTADGWLRTGDLGLAHAGELYITGRAKEIIFVNGQNYYPHDLEAIAQRAPGLELGKVVASGIRPRGSEIEQLVVFVLHRGGMSEFLPLATTVARLVNEQTGLEVTEVVPV
jgi:acyl-CoA synthetase (AMP-forming)/AMP-acid ligase II